MDRAPAFEASARPAAAGPLAIVLNPRSGSQERATAPAALQAMLRGCGRPYELLRIERPAQLARQIAQAVQLARERGGILVAAGGDGTVNAVAHAALQAGLPLGVLPRGTFNFFAQRHRLPIDAADAMRVVLQGRVAPVQAGLINGRAFLVNASLGLYPKLLEDRERFKQRYGRSRAVAIAAGLMTLLRERRRLSLQVERDGDLRRLQTSTLFVGNNALQLDRVGVDEAGAVEQGRLAAVSVKPVGRLAMAGLLLRGAIGRLGDADEVLSFSFRELEVAPIGRIGLPVVKVAFDGETARMHWPLRFEVSPQPLWLLVP
jgi:diacylglycerol kinase family enzyme